MKDVSADKREQHSSNVKAAYASAKAVVDAAAALASDPKALANKAVDVVETKTMALDSLNKGLTDASDVETSAVVKTAGDLVIELEQAEKAITAAQKGGADKTVVENLTKKLVASKVAVKKSRTSAAALAEEKARHARIDTQAAEQSAKTAHDEITKSIAEKTYVTENAPKLDLVNQALRDATAAKTIAESFFKAVEIIAPTGSEPSSDILEEEAVKYVVKAKKHSEEAANAAQKVATYAEQAKTAYDKAVEKNGLQVEAAAAAKESEVRIAITAVKAATSSAEKAKVAAEALAATDTFKHDVTNDKLDSSIADAVTAIKKAQSSLEAAKEEVKAIEANNAAEAQTLKTDIDKDVGIFAGAAESFMRNVYAIVGALEGSAKQQLEDTKKSDVTEAEAIQAKQAIDSVVAQLTTLVSSVEAFKTSSKSQEVGIQTLNDAYRGANTKLNEAIAHQAAAAQAVATAKAAAAAAKAALPKVWDIVVTNNIETSTLSTKAYENFKHLLEQTINGEGKIQVKVIDAAKAGQKSDTILSIVLSIGQGISVFTPLTEPIKNLSSNHISVLLSRRTIEPSSDVNDLPVVAALPVTYGQIEGDPFHMVIMYFVDEVFSWRYNIAQMKTLADRLAKSAAK